MELTLPTLASPRTATLAPARIALTYLWRHHRLLDLDDPQTFTALVQHRKLHDRDARLPPLADKVLAKEIVADRIGREWVIPTLWHGVELPRCPDWPTPFVVKSRHGCNQNAFVRRWDAAEWRSIRTRARRWMYSDYGGWLDEWLYAHIQRGLLVEPLVGPLTGAPIDYKLYVFGGRVEYIQVHLGRGQRHRWIVFDRNWRRRSSPTSDLDPAPPSSLAAMMSAAGELARGIDFVRVDMYEIDRKPLFGEMTFYPGSGLDRFDPIGLDAEMGRFWLKAKSEGGVLR